MGLVLTSIELVNFLIAYLSYLNYTLNHLQYAHSYSSLVSVRALVY